MNAILAAISGHSLTSLLIQVLIAGVIFWLLWWLLSVVSPPEPFSKIARVILAVLAVIWAINLLLGLTGQAFIVW